jgi:NAD-specific glutamate dehydrogenase
MHMRVQVSTLLEPCSMRIESFCWQADAFVPAGGRPGTLNLRNYRDYLSAPGGAASAPLIVEGANLFITPEARQASP